MRVFLEDLRETEVDDLHEVEPRAQRLEHDVVGLQVTVNDAEGVRLFQGAERLPQHVDHAGQRERTLVARHAAQIAAAQVLHHDVRAAVVGASEVEDRDRVGVAQTTRGARFVEEPRGRELFVRQARVHDLDGDRTAQGDLLGAIDASHSADSDEVRHAITAGQRSSDERILSRRLRRQLSAARKAEAMGFVAGDAASLTRDHQ